MSASIAIVSFTARYPIGKFAHLLKTVLFRMDWGHFIFPKQIYSWRSPRTIHFSNCFSQRAVWHRYVNTDDRHPLEERGRLVYIPFWDLEDVHHGSGSPLVSIAGAYVMSRSWSTCLWMCTWKHSKERLHVCHSAPIITGKRLLFQAHTWCTYDEWWADFHIHHVQSPILHVRGRQKWADFIKKENSWRYTSPKGLWFRVFYRGRRICIRLKNDWRFLQICHKDIVNLAIRLALSFVECSRPSLASSRILKSSSLILMATRRFGTYINEIIDKMAQLGRTPSGKCDEMGAGLELFPNGRGAIQTKCSFHPHPKGDLARAVGTVSILLFNGHTWEWPGWGHHPSIKNLLLDKICKTSKASIRTDWWKPSELLFLDLGKRYQWLVHVLPTATIFGIRRRYFHLPLQPSSKICHLRKIVMEAGVFCYFWPWSG